MTSAERNDSEPEGISLTDTEKPSTETEKPAKGERQKPLFYSKNCAKVRYAGGVVELNLEGIRVLCTVGLHDIYKFSYWICMVVCPSFLHDIIHNLHVSPEIFICF